MSEHAEQVKFFKWVRNLRPYFSSLESIFAVPNAGDRSIGAAMFMKAEGLEAGVPDVPCLHPTVLGSHNGLAIEFKHGKNKQTAKQELWQLICEECNFKYVICYTWMEAVEIVTELYDINSKRSLR